ncbi:MAG: type II secretion system F family protein [Acidobacteriia bacterium]|nr:type II secretion system F family protein [Terriglobia bacterium]
MAEFLCKIAQPSGLVIEEVFNANTEAELRMRFVDQGCLVYWIKERGRVLSIGGRSRGGGKIKEDQFMIFNQQLVTLIHAGLPILKSLDLLIPRVENPVFRNLLEDIREQVKSGKMLSEAFEAQGVFSRVYTASLFAGEKSGNLEEVLKRYINYQKVSSAVRKKIIGSLVYPLVLVVLVTGLLSFILTYVIPKFQDLYEGMNATLPGPTLFLISLSSGIRSSLIVVVPALIIGALFLRVWWRSAPGKRFIDGLKLKLPLLGNVWLKFSISQWARTLSTLLAGGIPAVQALETSIQASSNQKISDAVLAAAQSVREGKSIAKSLEATAMFPPLVVEMVEVGESTGALEHMLASVADFFDEEVNTRVAALLTLIEPAILVFMGTVIAFILIALYLPVFSLSSQMGH